MSIFSNKWLSLQAYFITIATTFLLTLFCSILYTLLPLKMQILPFFANLCLGIASFAGAFYIAHKSPYLKIKSLFVFILSVFATFLFISFFYGVPDIHVLLHKYLLIIISAILGTFCGKIN